eukprot:2938314-Rhodomonas_salina.2
MSGTDRNYSHRPTRLLCNVPYRLVTAYRPETQCLSGYAFDTRCPELRWRFLGPRREAFLRSHPGSLHYRPTRVLHCEIKYKKT